MKKLYLAYPRGFCAGVRRALEAVEAALIKSHETVHVYHEIVHNDYVVNKLKSRGVIFVNDLKEVPKGGIIIFSAHGVSAAIEKQAAERSLRIIDATCPLVKKIHLRGEALIHKGYIVLIIGHRNHPEIKGTIGQLNGDAFVIENKEDAQQALKNIPPDSKVAYLTQTTLSVSETRDIVHEIKKIFPNIEGDSDICYATTNRQHAVKAIAAKCDTVFIIGSPKSSNSNRLREVAENHGTRAYLINDFTEIKPEMLNKAEIIGISAGASAPDCLVHDLCEQLEKRGWPKPELLESKSENIIFPIPEIRI